MLKMNEYASKTKVQLYIQKSLEMGGPKMKYNLLISQRRKLRPREIKRHINQTWLPALQILTEGSICPRERPAFESLWHVTFPFINT